jgi:uncharacterized phiE125 gp8 family phage protein
MIPTCAPAWPTIVLVVGPTAEPFTLDQAKLVAGVDWAAGDPREALMRGWIAAARSKVEQDVSLPLLTQTLDLYVTAIVGPTITLVRPPGRLQAVTWVQYTDSSGLVQVLDPALYSVDFARGQITLTSGVLWPTSITVRIVAGWETPEALQTAPPLLVHAVGLLIAHYTTFGRDLAVLAIGTLATMPKGYADAIVSYQPVAIA